MGCIAEKGLPDHEGTRARERRLDFQQKPQPMKRLRYKDKRKESTVESITAHRLMSAYG